MKFTYLFFFFLNFSNQSQVDVDSGIETMEVDESDRVEHKRKRVSHVFFN